MGMSYDAPPRGTYLHTNQLLQGPAEGESRISHLVGTASGYDLPSHSISLGSPIVTGFSLKSFYIGLGMARCVLLHKHLGTTPYIVPIPENTALAWNKPRQGHLRPTTIFQLWITAKPDPVEPFRDQHPPLLPLPSNGKRHSQLAPWHTPSRFSEESLNLEGGDQ